MERIKKKYRRRIDRNAGRPGTEASKAAFRAQAIIDRDNEIAEEHAQWTQELGSGSDSDHSSQSSPSSPRPPDGEAEHTILDDEMPIVPENERPMVPENEQPVVPENEQPVAPENDQLMLPENELVIINQVNTLLGQLAVVQAQNRARSAAASEQLNAAANQMIGARWREFLGAQHATKSMGRFLVVVPMLVPEANGNSTSSYLSP